jgi:cysteine synthase A
LAYFAKLLEIPFIAVIPRGTSQEKIASIKFYGGAVEQIDDPDTTAAADALAREKNGHFCNQFANAAIATDWRGNNNIAESAFAQLALETHSEPAWVVMAAGTGGTTATFGRWIRYRSLKTKLCLPDPEGSIFHDVVQSHQRGKTQKFRQERRKGSRIEGIGRPCWQTSFMPQLIDRSEQVDDGASGIGMQIASELLGKSVGISTGTHFIQVCRLASEMAARGEPGSILSVICDSGDRYQTTFGDAQWRLYNGMVGSSWDQALRGYLDTGKLEEPG